MLNLYIFDPEFRLLLLDAIERAEVSLRAQWAYHMAHKHGPHSYLDASLATDQKLHARHLGKLQDEISRSDEMFIQHLDVVCPDSQWKKRLEDFLVQHQIDAHATGFPEGWRDPPCLEMTPSRPGAGNITHFTFLINALVKQREDTPCRIDLPLYKAQSLL